VGLRLRDSPLNLRPAYDRWAPGIPLASRPSPGRRFSLTQTPRTSDTDHGRLPDEERRTDSRSDRGFAERDRDGGTDCLHVSIDRHRSRFRPPHPHVKFRRWRFRIRQQRDAHVRDGRDVPSAAQHQRRQAHGHRTECHRDCRSESDGYVDRRQHPDAGLNRDHYRELRTHSRPHAKRVDPQGNDVICGRCTGGPGGVASGSANPLTHPSGVSVGAGHFHFLGVH
jgi:hypothetical protein